MSEPLAQLFDLIFFCFLTRVRTMKVSPGPLQLKNYAGAFAFAYYTVDGSHYGFYVRENNSRPRGHCKDRFKSAAVFCLHKL